VSPVLDVALLAVCTTGSLSETMEFDLGRSSSSCLSTCLTYTYLRTNCTVNTRA
jgi:hypothetical protein